MKKFKYSIEYLIELVEQQPILWDKTCEGFKDNIRKERAWKEVFKFLDENFDSLDGEQQRKIGMAITTKWKNIRDAFVRSLKKQYSQGQLRKYLYHDKLTFLLKLVEKDNTDSNITESSTLQFTECSGSHTADEKETPSSYKIEDNLSKPSGRSSCLKRKAVDDDAVDNELLKTIKEMASSSSPDEDESFFASVTPSVRTMTEDEKLEFRIGVLDLIRKIKKRRLLETVSLQPCSSSSAQNISITSPDYSNYSTRFHNHQPNTQNFDFKYEQIKLNSNEAES